MFIFGGWGANPSETGEEKKDDDITAAVAPPSVDTPAAETPAAETPAGDQEPEINDEETVGGGSLVGDTGTVATSSTLRSKRTDVMNHYFVQGLTDEENDLIMRLVDKKNSQEHLFDVWEKFHPSAKRLIVKNLVELDNSIPGEGGLEGYIQRSKHLLQKSRRNMNPFDGWVPSVPTGAAFDFGTQEYRDMERVGIQDLPRMGFVLVAGGLGERLGYKDGIKLELPIDLATKTSYLKHYIEYIVSIQEKFCKRFTQLPLCIMVSKETKESTIKLLRDNSCFGLCESQIYMIQQGNGVPAFTDNDARLMLDEHKTNLLTKPHGHGDIHSMLYRSGVAARWIKKYNTKWMVFFQDTNGLAFHTLPLMIGVSKKYNLLMNSLAVPRKAKQTIGGLTKLTHKGTGEEVTLNVECNQLDALLRSTKEFRRGDVNDERTGFSPFPGNVNQILFNAKDYVKVLERTHGIMPEFVDPKYDESDLTRTKFNKPIRLECMMQDFPKVLLGREAKRVGFTGVSSDMCFSPVTNDNTTGMKIQENDSVPPGTAANGEADQYAAFRKMCLVRGIQIDDSKEEVWDGIKVTPGPEIIFKPDFITCPYEMKMKFPYPDRVRISARSSLVVFGSGVVIESLDLDGALVIKPRQKDDRITIKDCLVRNQGWKREPVKSLTTLKKEKKERERRRKQDIELKELRRLEALKTENLKKEEEQLEQEKIEREEMKKIREEERLRKAEEKKQKQIRDGVYDYESEEEEEEEMPIGPKEKLKELSTAAKTAAKSTAVGLAAKTKDLTFSGAGLAISAIEFTGDTVENTAIGLVKNTADLVTTVADISEGTSIDEKMRGYKLVKKGTMLIEEQPADCVIQ